MCPLYIIYQKLPKQRVGTNNQTNLYLKNSAPDGIRTRVEASRGPHDWPLHYRSEYVNDCHVINKSFQKIFSALVSYCYSGRIYSTFFLRAP